MVQVTITDGRELIAYPNLLYAEPSTHQLPVRTVNSLPVLAHFGKWHGSISGTQSGFIGLRGCYMLHLSSLSNSFSSLGKKKKEYKQMYKYQQVIAIIIYLQDFFEALIHIEINVKPFPQYDFTPNSFCRFCFPFSTNFQNKTDLIILWHCNCFGMATHII